MLLLTVVCLVLANFQVSLQANYDFRPDSRHIEINDGDDYYIGFEETGQTNFNHCYITSDTISTDYEIVLPSNETDAQSDTYSGFSPYNGTGICAFVYFSVNDKVPVKWTISAYDNVAEKNFTEEVTVIFYYNMPLFLDKLVALPTASVATFFKAESTNLTRCTVSFDNTTVDLDLNSVKVYSDDNALKSRLTSLGGGKCGYKINNVTKGDPVDFTLYATDDQNKAYRSSSQLVVVPGANLADRVVEAYLGGSARVICGKESDGSTNSDQKFCHLLNPEGVLMSRDQMCNYDLDIVTINDLGTWKCTVGYEYVMDALEFTTQIVEKKPETIATFGQDTTDYYILGCQLVNFDVSSLEYCKFTRPDGKIFKVTTGGVNENYNSFSSDLDNGKCSLEILKPLRDEDKGTWKCEGASYGTGTQGAFIDVEKSTIIPYNKHLTKIIQMGNSFVIDCMVPFPSDYCYIIAPNETQYRPEHSLQITSGTCLYTVDKATPTDNGTWKCSIGQKNGSPDEIITVEVSIIELKILYANAEASEGEDADLICNTNGIPIEYCRFVSPSGTSYSLRKENTVPKKISYLGRGLEYGDCGIKISDVAMTDGGQWTCHISSGRSDYTMKADLSRKMALSVTPPSSDTSLAASVGIAVGVLAVAIITGGFVFYKYSGQIRRRGARTQPAHPTAQFSERSFVHYKYSGRIRRRGVRTQPIHRTAQFSERSSTSSGESVILSVPQGT